MAFSDYVARVFGKRPVWLYRISVGGVAYHITSKGRDFTTPNNRPSTDFPTGQLWTSTPIQRGDITLTVKSNRSGTWLRLPTSNVISQALISDKDTDDAEVEIWEGFIGDPDNEFQSVFKGRIMEVEPAMIATTLTCGDALSKSSRSSVAQVVQRPCRHAHYFTNSDGGGCRLNLADFQTTHAATAAVGRTVTVPDAASQDDGFYLAGIFEYDGTEYMIESHIGNTLVLESAPDGLAAAIALDGVSEDVLLAAGCDLSATTCNSFGNIANFGGFNDMTDSPFDGRSIA